MSLIIMILFISFLYVGPQLYVNKVGPYFNPHETYHYYQLPVCRPDKRYSIFLHCMYSWKFDIKEI